jgi:predicted secreted protein
MTTDRLLFAAYALAGKIWTRVCLFVLPWSSRSQHESYLHGYRDGLKDAATRRNLGLRS